MKTKLAILQSESKPNQLLMDADDFKLSSTDNAIKLEGLKPFKLVAFVTITKKEPSFNQGGLSLTKGSPFRIHCFTIANTALS